MRLRSRLQWIALALAPIVVLGVLVFYYVYIREMWYPRSYVVSLGDVDGDGDVDVLATHYLQEYRVWLNDGAGRFAPTR